MALLRLKSFGFVEDTPQGRKITEVGKLDVVNADPQQ